MPKGESRQEREARKAKAIRFKKDEKAAEKRASEVTRQTAVGKKKYKRKVYAAGSNILTRENQGKKQSYDEALKAGTRADDPRNWEFHYKEAGGRRMGNRGGGKGGDGKRVDLGRLKAESMARKTGKDVYNVKKMEWGTAQTRGETSQATANRKAMGQRGTTRVAKNLAAQKQMATRKRGRAGATLATDTRKRGVA